MQKLIKEYKVEKVDIFIHTSSLAQKSFDHVNDLPGLQLLSINGLKAIPLNKLKEIKDSHPSIKIFFNSIPVL